MPLDPSITALLGNFDNAYEKAQINRGDGGLGRWPRPHDNPNAPHELLLEIKGVEVKERDFTFKKNKEDKERQSTPGVRVQFTYGLTPEVEEMNFDCDPEFRGVPIDLALNSSVLPEGFWQDRHMRALGVLRGHAEGLSIEWGSPLEVIQAIVKLLDDTAAADTVLWATVKLQVSENENKNTGKVYTDHFDSILSIENTAAPTPQPAATG